MQQNITCPECDGSGKVPLSDHLKATLGCFTIRPKLHAEELFEFDDWDGIGVTTINNRLEELRRLGFLGRTKNGKMWTYFLKPKRKAK